MIRKKEKKDERIKKNKDWKKQRQQRTSLNYWGKDTRPIILGCWDTNGSPTLGQTTISSDKSTKGGACGVMVIAIGNGHGDTSSNPGQDWWHFT